MAIDFPRRPPTPGSYVLAPEIAPYRREDREPDIHWAWPEPGEIGSLTEEQWARIRRAVSAGDEAQ